MPRPNLFNLKVKETFCPEFTYASNLVKKTMNGEKCGWFETMLWRTAHADMLVNGTDVVPLVLRFDRAWVKPPCLDLPLVQSLQLETWYNRVVYNLWRQSLIEGGFDLPQYRHRREASYWLEGVVKLRPEFLLLQAKLPVVYHSLTLEEQLEYDLYQGITTLMDERWYNAYTRERRREAQSDALKREVMLCR